MAHIHWIHSNHTWQALVYAEHLRDETASGDRNVASLLEKTEKQRQPQQTGSCCDGGSTQHWGAQMGTPSQTAEAKGSFPVNSCPSWVLKEKRALSRKWQQEHVRRGGGTAERRSCERARLISGAAEQLGTATLHILHIHFPFLSWEALISHSYEQSPECKAEVNRVIGNEKRVDGYLWRWKQKHFLIFLKRIWFCF